MELSTLDGSAWEAALDRLPLHSFFATPLWGLMLDDSELGYKCLALEADLGGIQVLLPMATSTRFGVTLRQSMPFGTYGGPLVVDEEENADHEKASRRLAVLLGKRWRSGILFATPGPHPHLELPDPYASYETDLLDLTAGKDALWKALDKDARNQVRQAERAEVDVRVDNSEAAFRDYYEMLEASAKRWGSKRPKRPWSLFASISRHATDQAVRLWLAYVDGRPAAGCLCFYGRCEVFYWSAAMHEGVARARPNTLLQWRVIADAADRGYQVYNMGASGELTGVRRFKEQFGAQPRSYPAYLIPGRLLGWGRLLAQLPLRVRSRG
jgi:CelD/BcsL family acetyltransferase involved in cellulose biosynthesis